MRNLLTQLNQPFPDYSKLPQSSLRIAAVSIFIILFLYIFQPFQLSKYQGNKLIFSFYFGLNTFIASLLYESFCQYILNLQKDIPQWTLKKWIIYCLGLLLTIAIGNYILLMLYFKTFSFQMASFLSMLFYTILLGSIPITVSGFIIQLKALKTNQQHAKTLAKNLAPQPSHQQTITLKNQNQSQSLTINTKQILFIESMQNYVQVHYLDDNAQLQQQTLRNTLSNLQQQLADTSIIRCHRSFLVNTMHIINIEGNAQGLKLQLTKLSNQTIIPVSRKYIEALKSITTKTA